MKTFFKRLSHFISETGFRTKILISYCLVASLLCGVIGFVYYRTTSDALYQMVAKDATVILQKNNQIIDQQLKNIENYANRFVSDPELSKYIQQYQDAQSVYDYYQLDGPITQLLHNYFSSSPIIFSVCVMTKQMSYGELLGANIIPVQTFPKTDIFQTTMEGNGKTVWIPTYNFFDEYGQATINSDRDPYKNVFSAAKLIWQTKDDYFILIINFLDNIYSQVFETQYTEYQGSYIVLTADGRIIGQSKSESANISLTQPSIKQIFKSESGNSRYQFGGESYIICYDTSQTTGWISAYIIKQDTLVNKFAYEMLKNLTIILILMILLPLLLVLFINSKLLRPLASLQNGIRNVGTGNFKTVVKPQGFAEIKNLIASFNESNEKIDHLIAENYESQILKKEAELKAYTLQLNPHFILNTLNLINLRLIRDGNDELSEIISAMSRMMEYTLRIDSATVPFDIDLYHVKSYLLIMQQRHKLQFSVDYDIDEALLQTQVPKLFLQPLVENSIKHGFSSITYQGNICIRARKKDSLSIFEVEDNGCGFSEAALKSIQEGNNSHIGINNIRFRIRYLYGDKYSLSILPVTPHGSCIHIELPGQKPKQK